MRTKQLAAVLALYYVLALAGCGFLEIRSPKFDRTGLVAEFMFSGNANDSGPFHLKSLNSGASGAEDRFGMANQAYYFDGASYIEVADTSVLNFDNNFTLSAWINMEAHNRYGSRVIDKAIGSQGDGYLLDTYNPDFNGNHVRLLCGRNGPFSYLAGTDLKINKWYFIAATYSNGHGKIYVNGKLESENSSDTTAIKTAPVPLRIGMDTGVRTGKDFEDPMLGRIDDVRIFARALSAEEIAALYNP